MRGFTLIVASIGAVIAFAGRASAQVELKNDGYASGELVGFQGGFAAGEAGASRFTAPEAGRQLVRVELLFGGAATQKTVTLKVWDDSAGTDNPGAELYSEDFQLTGSDELIQQLTPTTTVTLPLQFRVGLVFQHAGYPSIARDNDGTIAAAKNFILVDGAVWVKSNTVGLTGDWIIRAWITPGTGPQPDAAPGTPDAAMAEACTGNSECPVGEYCDTTNHTCTFDCRDDNDCGGDTCNSLGQCVDGGGGGGCCRTDDGGGGAPGGVLLAIGVLVLVVRRRA